MSYRNSLIKTNPLHDWYDDPKKDVTLDPERECTHTTGVFRNIVQESFSKINKAINVQIERILCDQMGKIC